MQTFGCAVMQLYNSPLEKKIVEFCVPVELRNSIVSFLESFRCETCHSKTSVIVFFKEYNCLSGTQDRRFQGCCQTQTLAFQFHLMPFLTKYPYAKKKETVQRKTKLHFNERKMAPFYKKRNLPTLVKCSFIPTCKSAFACLKVFIRGWMTTEPTVLSERHLLETYLLKYVLKFYNLNVFKSKKRTERMSHGVKIQENQPVVVPYSVIG